MRRSRARWARVGGIALALSTLVVAVGATGTTAASAAPVCTITGTSGNDVLTGTPGDDVICGLEGNDRIDAGAGNDIVHGNGGNDLIIGGPGVDSLSGYAGDDTISDSGGVNRIFGGSGKDVLTGGPDFDTIVGDVVGDPIGWTDRISGGGGDDDLTGGEGDDEVVGNAGNDTIRGGGGNDRLFGGSGDDRLFGDLGDDLHDGQTGSDVCELDVAGDIASCDVALREDTNFVTGINRPWDMSFLADGTMFFTERPNGLRVRLADGQINNVLVPMPDLQLGSEGGVLGVAVDPGFDTNRYVFVCFDSNVPGGTGDVRVRRVVVNATFDGIESSTDVVTGMPRTTGEHSGCRTRFGPDGYLWITTGDSRVGTNPQNGQSLGGKVLRVDRDGNAAPGNNNIAGFDARIYTYGHRNVQGLAFQPGTNRAYSTEHGTDCNDEINLLTPGVNMGWDPVPGYNEWVPMTDFGKFPGARNAAWSSGCPTIAPSGATFLDGPQWGAWNGYLAVGVLKDQHVRVFRPEANAKMTSMAKVLENGRRIRSVVQGPDGALYVATDVGTTLGAIWRVEGVPTLP